MSSRFPGSGRATVAALLAAMALSAFAAGDGSGRCPDYDPERRNLYWGDLHVHTSYSLDAYAFGTRLEPRDAYAFARGAEVTVAGGRRVRLRRPLDFAAVTDHAETFDVMNLCAGDAPRDDEYCQGLRSGRDTGSALLVFRNFLLPLIGGEVPARARVCDVDDVDCPELARGLWRRVQEQANAANEACEFTAFIGNEWSATPGGRHWHRNLIYASDTVPFQAIDYLSYPTLDAFWEALDAQCLQQPGCDVLAIPHNSNLAEGGGFDVVAENERQRRLRARLERVFEIHQSKGTSECLPPLHRADDPDCGYEIVLPRRLQAAYDAGTLPESEWRKLRRAYARPVLLRGLREAEQGRGNPLQLGFIGSTDTHTGTPGLVDEEQWFGDAWAFGGGAAASLLRLDYSPGGLLGVWAEENTRSSLFAALRRREVYATSGPRIRLRFTAVSAADADVCASEPADAVVDATMGGSFGPVARAPRFVVQALMDEAPLVRVELVKGSVRDGVASEQLVTLFDEPAGRRELCVSWRDPEFDVAAPAFWYARVFERATPRWSAYACREAENCEDIEGADRWQRERAWASPIWYVPE